MDKRLYALLFPHSKRMLMLRRLVVASKHCDNVAMMLTTSATTFGQTHIQRVQGVTPEHLNLIEVEAS